MSWYRKLEDHMKKPMSMAVLVRASVLMLLAALLVNLVSYVKLNEVVQSNKTLLESNRSLLKNTNRLLVIASRAREERAHDECIERKAIILVSDTVLIVGRGVLHPPSDADIAMLRALSRSLKHDQTGC